MNNSYSTKISPSRDMDDLVYDFMEKCGYNKEDAIKAARNVFFEENFR